MKALRNHLDTPERYVKEVLYVKEVGVNQQKDEQNTSLSA